MNDYKLFNIDSVVFAYPLSKNVVPFSFTINIEGKKTEKRSEIRERAAGLHGLFCALERNLFINNDNNNMMVL